MSILSKIFGQGVAEPITAVGNVVDSLFTSDDERLSHEEVKMRLAQRPDLAQAEINKVAAGHRSVFVAGARPFLLWVAGAGLAFFYIPQYTMAAYVWSKTVLANGEIVAYPVSADGLTELVMAILGLGTLRTIEKLNGRAK
ncbi:3TM-type holin [Pseudemcibacter aquimaris]|uniref:3TM-type holin n=1 Tax=Pseudemcibacter aquimaris TaxID=2857064 RepID=UPI002012B7A3|nr:3TM-type holin [Pseudemcibacter aquimaris]MCC3859779.1 holin family protein [Pseudemcibacter aquimaris]WDU60173.1 holin family protein [Pseudemcibacter aquimaris]